MKLKVLFVSVLLASVAIVPCVMAEDPIAIPEGILNTEVKDWKFTGLTIAFGLMILGRFLAGLRNGGGIVGAVKGILFGTNTPPPPAPSNDPK